MQLAEQNNLQKEGEENSEKPIILTDETHPIREEKVCFQDKYKQTDPFIHHPATDTCKSKCKMACIACNIALANFYFGYCVVYFGQLDIQTMLNILQFDINPSVGKGLLNGCIPVGALVGALLSSILIANLSRRNCLLLINLCAFVVGGLIYIKNFYSLMFFRFLQGTFVGVYSSIAYLYVKQLCPIEIYGLIGGVASFIGVLGVFFGCFFAFILKMVTGDKTGQDFWFYLYGFPEVTIFLQSLILLFVFPYETPKYHLMEGKEEEAKKLIAILYKEQYVDYVLQMKKIDLEAAREKEKVQKEEAEFQVNGTFNQQEKSKNYSKLPIIMALHLSALQQFSGVNAIAIYAGNITSSVTSGTLGLLMPSLINFVQALGTFSTGLLLSRFGRKTVLQFGCLFEAVANIFVAIGFLTSVGQGFVLTGLFLYMAMFSISLGPVVWLYIPEVVQPKIIPFTTAMNWTSAALVIFLFPVVTNQVFAQNSGVPFIFFGAWCGVSFLINQKFLIETKGKTEVQIQAQFSGAKLVK